MLPLGMVLDQMGHRMNAPMHCAPILAAAVTEIRPCRHLTKPCHMNAVLNELVNALVLRRRNGHHRNAQSSLQRIDLNGSAVVPDLVHHIQRQHHGDTQFNELNGQVEVALNIGGVQYVDNAVRMLLQQERPGHDFLTGIGRQRIDAR